MGLFLSSPVSGVGWEGPEAACCTWNTVPPSRDLSRGGKWRQTTLNDAMEGRQAQRAGMSGAGRGASDNSFCRDNWLPGREIYYLGLIGKKRS